MHPNYPSHILQQEYLNEDNEINNNNEEDEEGISALLIDPIRAFGEVIDTIENTNGNDYDDIESHDEEIIMEHDVDDDDEEDA